MKMEEEVKVKAKQGTVKTRTRQRKHDWTLSKVIMVIRINVGMIEEM